MPGGKYRVQGRRERHDDEQEMLTRREKIEMVSKLSVLLC